MVFSSYKPPLLENSWLPHSIATFDYQRVSYIIRMMMCRGFPLSFTMTMWVKHGKTIRHPKVARKIWVETITHGVVCSCFNHMKWCCSLQVAWPEWPDPRLRVGPGHDRPYVSAYEDYIYTYMSYEYKQSVCIYILYYIYYIYILYIIYYT